MTSGTQPPEQPELERLKRRLDELAEELVERELTLASLRGEVARFEARYLHLVGKRLAALDRLQAEIAALLAEHDPGADAQRAAQEAAARAERSAEALGDDAERPPRTAEERTPEPTDELRDLYRKAAKAVHPDRASDAADRGLRERVMAEVNAAYQAGDLGRLQRILDAWERQVQIASDAGRGAERVRVARAIVDAEARLEAIAREIQDIVSRDAYELYERAGAAADGGRDLLREMARELDRRIAAAQERLRELIRRRSEEAAQDAEAVAGV